MNLSKKKWINYISREMSLTAIYYPYKSQSSKVKFDYKNKNLFYFSKGTYIKGYKSETDYKSQTKAVIEIVKKGKLKETLLEFINIIEKRKRLSNRFIKTNLKKKSKKWLIKEFKTFHEFYKLYWSYHLIAFHLGQAVEKTKYEYVLKDYENMILKVRKVHPFKFYDEEYLPHLFKHLKKMYNVKEELWYFMMPTEIIRLLEGKLEIDIEELKKRLEYYLLTLKNGDEIIYSGDKAYKQYKKRISKEKIENFQELKGTITYKGKVKGIVKIVKLKKDLKNVFKNAILVTSQTTPDFIPVINTLKGIVTDEGGLTCHAAIISREMKVPCVVGTKIATKVLKDGDLVEVDANKGVVRKIE